MKTYPSIPRSIRNGVFYAFNKLDGSNIRAEWSHKKGFYKYGTRRRLLDPSDPVFGPSVALLEGSYAETLSETAKAQKWERAVFYFEYVGPNSFAGSHDPEDDMGLFLIDVAPYKKGLLGPEEFLGLFSEVPHAELLFHGNIDDAFVRSVRESTLEGMSLEGVIVKGVPGKTGPGMFKIKSNAWLEALKSRCGEDEKLFEKLK